MDKLEQVNMNSVTRLPNDKLYNVKQGDKFEDVLIAWLLGKGMIIYDKRESLLDFILHCSSLLSSGVCIFQFQLK